MPTIVIDHSMGGIIVREAINQYEGKGKSNCLCLSRALLVATLVAVSGENSAPLALPAWRDLNPENTFIKILYRKPLPTFLDHQLFYAYNNASKLKLGNHSDGVVPLFSQLHPEAQRQAHEQFGFNSSHVGILESEKMIDHLLDKINEIKSSFPEEQMDVLLKGSFDVPLSEAYSPVTQYFIRTIGKFLLALAMDQLKPKHPDQKHFVQAT